MRISNSRGIFQDEDRWGVGSIEEIDKIWHQGYSCGFFQDGFVGGAGFGEIAWACSKGEVEACEGIGAVANSTGAIDADIAGVPCEDILGVGGEGQVAFAEVHPPTVDVVEEGVLVVVMGQGYWVGEGEEGGWYDQKDQQWFGVHGLKYDYSYAILNFPISWAELRVKIVILMNYGRIQRPVRRKLSR